MKIILKKNMIIFLFTFLSNVIFSQTYIPGNTYYDATGYVEYRAGNLPIIISAPHGGSLNPATIPDRLCAGCVYERDTWTKPIAEGMYDKFVQQTGCYPHLIINLLHRKKFDANREIIEAADGNATVEQAWTGYHQFIDLAKSRIINDYGRGLFLDIHGHGHTIQRIELGYLLVNRELELADATLNASALINKSSIKGLVANNILGASHSNLLRGPNSFGALLDNLNFLTVPSHTIPFPSTTEPYFEGGYNTRRHGSRDNNIGIDAIQIEINSDIRNDSTIREILMNSLTTVTNNYINLYYNNQYLTNYCNLLSNVDFSVPENKNWIYPNPVYDYINIETKVNNFEVEIYNNLGQKVFQSDLSVKKINLNFLNSGLYLMQLKKDSHVLDTMKFIKN